jgi:hypothetical protein
MGHYLKECKAVIESEHIIYIRKIQGKEVIQGENYKQRVKTLLSQPILFKLRAIQKIHDFTESKAINYCIVEFIKSGQPILTDKKSTSNIVNRMVSQYFKQNPIPFPHKPNK